MKSRNLLPIAIQRCLVLNLPQNKFHKNSLKTEKNHNKFSSQIIVTSSQINVRNYCTKRTWTSLLSPIFQSVWYVKCRCGSWAFRLRLRQVAPFSGNTQVHFSTSQVLRSRVFDWRTSFWPSKMGRYAF